MLYDYTLDARCASYLIKRTGFGRPKTLSGFQPLTGLWMKPLIKVGCAPRILTYHMASRTTIKISSIVNMTDIGRAKLMVNPRPVFLGKNILVSSGL